MDLRNASLHGIYVTRGIVKGLRRAAPPFPTYHSFQLLSVGVVLRVAKPLSVMVEGYHLILIPGYGSNISGSP